MSKYRSINKTTVKNVAYQVAAHQAMYYLLNKRDPRVTMEGYGRFILWQNSVMAFNPLAKAGILIWVTSTNNHWLINTTRQRMDGQLKNRFDYAYQHIVDAVEPVLDAIREGETKLQDYVDPQVFEMTYELYWSDVVQLAMTTLFTTSNGHRSRFRRQNRSAKLSARPKGF